MKLFVYRHPSGVRNFGDELGEHVFPPLLPGLFDEDESSLFLGIGSILFDFLPARAHKIVLGAGFAGYTARPRLDASWTILGVRGPLTATALGLDPSLALGDPAMLLGVVLARAAAVAQTEVGPMPHCLMPHWQSLARGDWQRAAELAGLRLIDPRRPVSEVLALLRSCRLLLTEAMHGAIVADALRVPWVALLPLDPAHRMKWHDWAGSLSLSLRPSPLRPSSLGERLSLLRLGRRRPGARLVRALPGLAGLGGAAFAEAAAESLRRAAAAPPMLSSDAALDRALSRLQEALAKVPAVALQARR